MKTLLLLISLAIPAAAQVPESWTTPGEPVKIAGPIHYVGTADLGAYLIATGDGLILLDVPYQKNVPLILANVKKLGFDPNDIRILIASHAHYDHIGGFAEMREKTGAKIMLSAADAELAARGGLDDFAFGDTVPYPPVKADALVEDGDVVRLGKVAMTAMLTPGHTRGCTTWRMTIEEAGKPLDVVFGCSLSAPGYRLVKNEAYPQIFDDYRASFAKLRRLDPDIFLANHGGFFGLTAKLAATGPGKPNPFIARGEFAKYLDKAWKALADEEAKQRAAQ